MVIKELKHYLIKNNFKIKILVIELLEIGHKKKLKELLKVKIFYKV